jgi:hypothetical protein
MYCPHFKLDNRDCSGQCDRCPYGCIPFAPNQSWYECADCHGKFTSPSFSFISSDIEYK